MTPEQINKLASDTSLKCGLSYANDSKVIASALSQVQRETAEPLEARIAALEKALRDIAVATPIWNEGAGSYAGGETWCGFSNRLKRMAVAAISQVRPTAESGAAEGVFRDPGSVASTKESQ